MASDLIEKLTSRLSLDEIDIDNWTFKIYSRLTVGIFMMAAAASAATSYGGDAIKCYSGGSYDESYCWLHGTSHLPASKLTLEVNNNDNCIRYDPNETSEDADKDTKYYIWVSLVLFINGIIFLIPDQLWKHFEGNMLKQFGENRMDFLKDTDEATEKFNQLSNNLTRRYFFTFVFFECLNLLTAIGSFAMIDTFLSGRFYGYGSDAINFYTGKGVSTEIKTSKGTENVKLNPMCSVFPTIVSCDYHIYGVTGELDKRNNICILGQNLMNQKMFLVIWIWFMVLFAGTACMILYRLVTLFSEDGQTYTIQYYAKSEDKEAVIKIKLGLSFIGNWFLLTQIGRNSDPYRFREFLDKLTGSTRRNKMHEKIKSVDTSNNEESGGNTLELQQR